MRLTRVEVAGYGRIRNASFACDRKLTAILGPNEAGKSTLLRALLSLNNDDPVPFAARNRTSQVNDDDIMIRVTYRLDESDLTELRGRPWENLPTRLTLEKRAGGARQIIPDQYARLPETSWKSALDALHLFRNLVDDALVTSSDLTAEENAEREYIAVEFQRLFDEIESRDVSMSADDLRLLHERITRELGATLAPSSLFDPVAEAAAEILAEPRPSDAVVRHLEERRPEFALFSEQDRRLEHEYLLADLANEVPVALSNFMSLAGRSLSDVLPDSARRTAVATAQDAATETLEHVFKNAWKQHPISVRLGFESDRLTLLVRDRGKGGQTIAFDERSDGLRTFVALTAFLATKGGAVPPVLLIDEAESRLHWDAQADLISVLQTSSEVGQILYTTHSPGCLPPDLGTGVIFVQPDSEDPNASVVRRDFWAVESANAFGASPILFMMGASAAAFSRVRQAVVAEGPSDMMLLPTLFRAATKKEELDFQVVPGISTTAKDRLSSLDEEGIRVAYIVDGDDQGKIWRSQLISEGRVDADRILALPEGNAVEDLFDRSFYLTLFLEVIGQDVSPGELALEPGPLKPQLEQLCEVWGVTAPTSIDVAEAILAELDATAPSRPDHARVKLSSGSGKALRDIHAKLESLLSPVLFPSAPGT